MQTLNPVLKKININDLHLNKGAGFVCLSLALKNETKNLNKYPSNWLFNVNKNPHLSKIGYEKNKDVILNFIKNKKFEKIYYKETHLNKLKSFLIPVDNYHNFRINEKFNQDAFQIFADSFYERIRNKLIDDIKNISKIFETFPQSKKTNAVSIIDTFEKNGLISLELAIQILNETIKRNSK